MKLALEVKEVLNKNNILGNPRLPKERFVFEFDIDIFVVPQNKLAFQRIFKL